MATTKYTFYDDNNTQYACSAMIVQTFTPSTTHILTSIKLKLWRTLLPGICKAQIRATSADAPLLGATNYLTATTFDGDTVDSSSPGSLFEITFSTPIVVTAGTKYAICIQGGDNTDNLLWWRTDTTSPTYAGGWQYSGNLVGQEPTAWQSIPANDLQFEEWGEAGNNAPSATTQAASAIAATTATGNGNVTSLGYPAATQHGHAWGKAPDYPTVAPGAGVSALGVPAATGAYTSSLTGLEPGTTYNIISYITNIMGSFYGDVVQFTTSAGDPTVTTDLVESVAATTATGKGSIDNLGGSAVTQHGHCWSTSADPTTADSKTEKGAGVVGAFTSPITGLSVNTLYHVRAYATNSSGTGYGADVTFTTNAAGAPIVTTQAVTNIQATNVTGNGNLVDIGGAAVTQHGHVWGTSANPTTADSKTENGAATAGAFTSAITGLAAGTTYYVRAYATNSYGTSYGDNVTVIAGTAGEGKGIIIVLGEHLAYVSKTGNQRALLGIVF